MNSKVLQIINVIAVIGAVIFNALVNIIPVNNITTGEVSDAFPSLFTPPGYVFSIWAVIYTLASVFMAYQVRTNQREEPYLQQIGILYFVGSMINVLDAIFLDGVLPLFIWERNSTTLHIVTDHWISGHSIAHLHSSWHWTE